MERSRASWTKKLRNSVVVVGATLIAAFFAWPGLTWPAIKARIAKEFPKVKSISTAELAARLGSKSEPKPVLLDVRTTAEYDVSRIADARRVDPDAATVALPKDTPIITYCSVGYRSAKLSQRLQDAGFTNVQNLEGSIFQWANEGRPLTSEHGAASKVHPFDKKWGVLLDPARRSE